MPRRTNRRQRQGKSRPVEQERAERVNTDHLAADLVRRGLASPGVLGYQAWMKPNAGH